MNGIIISHQPNLRGASRSLLNIVKKIDLEIMKPHVVFTHDGPIVPDFSKAASVTVMKMHLLRGLPRRFVRWRTTAAARRILLGLVDDLKADIIYLNTVGKNVAVEVALEIRGPRKIVHFHEMDYSAMGDPVWTQRLVAECDLIIACSNAVKDFIVRCFDVNTDKIRVLYECTDTEQMDANSDVRAVAEVRAALEIPSDGLLIGSVGSTIFRKGLDLFIGAAALLRECWPALDLHFCWVGGDENARNSIYYKNMIKLVNKSGLSGRFHWIHETPNPTCYQRAMDIFVLPSREDPFPLAVQEAMYLRRPVVAFSVGGVPEILSDGHGILVERLSSATLSEGIGQLLKDSDLRLEMGERGRALVSEVYSLSSYSKINDILVSFKK